MAISYGTITITDKTDLGQLSVFLTANSIRQQIYDVNNGNYNPNWDTQNQGNALIIAPNVFYNGESKTYNDFVVSWSKIEDGTTYSIPDAEHMSAVPETIDNQQRLVRNVNLATNTKGIIYQAEIRYYPISGDVTTFLTATATLDFSLNQTGRDGEEGQQGKNLKLIGNGSYFTYHYDGELFGSQTITLTVQKSESVYGVHWYCKNANNNTYTPIKIIGGNPSTDTNSPNWSTASYYTETSLAFAGKSLQNQLDILDLIPLFINDRSAQFKIVEIDGEGTEIVNGMIDFLSIYALMEAAPGTDTYSSYLSNDGETVIDYEGSPLLDNAKTQLFISQGGVDDMENWHITVTDSITDATPTQTSFAYTLSNSKDTGSSTTNLDKYGPDRVIVTLMDVPAAMITFTAQHGVYNNNTFIADIDNPNVTDKVADIRETFSLSKSEAIVSHSLRLDAINAVKDVNGQYTPSVITVDAITRMGGGTEPYHTAGVIRATVYYTDNTTVSYSNTANNPLTLNLNTIGTTKAINYIETTLDGTAAQSYDDASDKQKITISLNGIDGESAWQFDLINSFDSINTKYNYTVITTETYEIPFKAFYGIIEQDIYHPSSSGANTYPRVAASLPQGSSIILKYYNDNDVEVTTGNNIVTKAKIFVTANSTNIGAEGIINFNFDIDGNHSITKQYSYKAIPKATDAISLSILAQPSNVFENQSGINIAEAIIRSGIIDITDQTGVGEPVRGLTWYIFDNDNGTWKTIVNSDSSITAADYYDPGIRVGYWNNSNPPQFTPGLNGAATTKLLKVEGSAVNGYAAFRLDATVEVNGVQQIYSEYINFIDKTDPLQVSLHSTLGEQLVNSQGIGVIYARIIRNNEYIDELPPDDQLGIGNVAPEGSDNTGPYENKLGYCVYRSDNGYLVDYYYRNSISGNWIKRNNPTAQYYWFFRDKNNEPINVVDTNVAINLRTLHHSDIYTNQQFVYLSGNVVANKLIADVRVEV